MDLRHTRQKFCIRWEKDFPWLRANNIDESLGVCTVCDKQLVCKKSHLERHERSYKHQRFLGFDVLVSEEQPQSTNTEFMECGRPEVKDEDEEYDEYAIEVDPSYDEFEKPETTYSDKTKEFEAPDGENNAPAKSSCSSKIDTYKLLKLIDRDRREINECYYSKYKGRSVSPTQRDQTQTLPTRDTYDLFFDSISASVKSLPPKLAAEVRIRISQVISEFEIRAICEREENVGTSDESAIVVATSAHENIPNLNEDEPQVDVTTTTAVPHIVYTYSKMNT